MAENTIETNLQTKENAVKVPKKANLWIKRGVPLAVLAILALLPVFQIVEGTLNYYLHMLMYVFLYVIMSSSWNVIGGFAGYVSLGHNAFFALGAYFAGMLFLATRISPFVSAPVAGLLAMPLINLEGQFAKIPYYYYLLVVMVICVVMTYFIKHSKFGLALRAISQD